MGSVLKLALFALAIWLFFRFLKNLLNKDKDSFAKPSRFPGSTDVLPCAHCGTYVPRDEAIEHQGKYFCSNRHLEARAREK